MKKVFQYILFVSLFFSTVYSAYSQEHGITEALRLYREGSFLESSLILEKIYKKDPSYTYFEYYVYALYRSGEKEKAFKEIEKYKSAENLLKTNILLGSLWEFEGEDVKADKAFESSIKLIEKPSDVSSVVTAFFIKQKYQWCVKAYAKGEALFPEINYHSDKARMYGYAHEYELMIKEYIQFLSKRPQMIEAVQASIENVGFKENTNDLYAMLSSELIRIANKGNSDIAISRLLSWSFSKQKLYDRALDIAISVDKKGRSMDKEILSLSKKLCLINQYSDARRGYDYLLAHEMDKDRREAILLARLTDMQYHQFQLKETHSIEDIQKMGKDFLSTKDSISFPRNLKLLMLSYADFQKVYKRDEAEALNVLESTYKMSGLKAYEYSDIKQKMVDILVRQKDFWTANLYLTQIIREEKDNTHGDNAKYEKALLGYFMGDYSWSKANLDILKASTSKLTANDAMSLSTKIRELTEEDTTHKGVNRLAEADWYLYCNELDSASLVLDSIEISFQDLPQLMAYSLYTRAHISISKKEYSEAKAQLVKLISNYSFSSLSDDAYFYLGEISYLYLKDNTSACSYFNTLIKKFPTSIWVDKARDLYQNLITEKSLEI